MIQFIKRWFKKWFTTPEHVLYVNVSNMNSNEINTYMDQISKNLNIRNTLYIPTRTRETEFIKL